MNHRIKQIKMSNHKKDSFYIHLREEFLTFNRNKLLKIAKETLDVKQNIRLFWTSETGVIEVAYPHLTFGIKQRLKKALDKEPILLYDDKF